MKKYHWLLIVLLYAGVSLCMAGTHSAYSGFFNLTAAVAVEKQAPARRAMDSELTALVLENSVHFIMNAPRVDAVSLQIYDVRGALIKSFGLAGQGSFHVDWDMRDQGGADVSAGLYLCRVKAAAMPLYRSFVIVR